MPNTLVHLGVQGAITRTLWKNADLKWIYVGCIIPDVPWIAQRIVRLMPGDGISYSSLFYLSIQASLFFCIILSAAIAVFSSRFQRTFLILGSGSLLHLLLDACQNKWANGVSLSAPFSWQLINFGFFWPESLSSYLLTIFGLIFFAAFWRRSVSVAPSLEFRSPFRYLLSAVLLVAYFALPSAFLYGPAKADTFYVTTLRNRQERPGKPVAFDRATYKPGPGDNNLRIFTGEKLEVEGIELDKPAMVSLRGSFISEKKVRVDEYHVHKPVFRDTITCFGLGLVALLWIFALIKHRGKTEIDTISLRSTLH